MFSVQANKQSVISGFRRDVHDICALLGYYTASCGNPLPKFQDNVSVPSSRIKNSYSSLFGRTRDATDRSPWQGNFFVVICKLSVIQRPLHSIKRRDSVFKTKSHLFVEFQVHFFGCDGKHQVVTSTCPLYLFVSIVCLYYLFCIWKGQFKSKVFLHIKASAAMLMKSAVFWRNNPEDSRCHPDSFIHYSIIS